MSVIRPALSSSERTTERRAVTVIRRSPSFLRPQTIVEGLPQETPTDPYLPVDWKTGDVITAARLNATDEGVDKNADAIERLKEALQKPSLILRPESFYLLHRSNFCANDCSGYF